MASRYKGDVLSPSLHVGKAQADNTCGPEGQKPDPALRLPALSLIRLKVLITRSFIHVLERKMCFPSEKKSLK